MTQPEHKKPHSRQSKAVQLESQPSTPPTPPVPTTEVDPVFTASEAAKFVSGDKAKLDNLAAIVASQAALIANQAATIADLTATVANLSALVASQAAINADLQAQIDALKPVTHIAVGFGDARACGVLTKSYDWNGYPTYTTPGGARYYVADINHYRCDLSGGTMNTDYVNPDIGTVVGNYTVSMGMSPAGSVS